MTLYGYTSRNIPDAKTFSDVLEQRMQAKAAGDKATANALKLVVNTTYGASLNQYNALYDPLMGRSVCITGQLFLLELAMNLYNTVPETRIVQLNTDGIMIEYDDVYLDQINEILTEWQERTGFELEEDDICQIYQKDVNNYIEVKQGGSVKVKGGYLVRGIATAGAFKINNEATIVSKAIIDYFVKGTPVEDTINGSTDLLEFQYIAKAGSKYSRSYTIFNGIEVDVQKVNRVYAIADDRYGTLYKVKKETGGIAKIENLPEHCVLDNKNQLSIDVVDRQFYIDLAKKRINDFLGIKPEKKGRKKNMPTPAPKLNVYQKLIEARAKFIESNPAKTGKNMHLSFMYFELEDIVPTCTKIFREIGLLPVVSFTRPYPDDHDNWLATMTIINTELPSEVVVFEAPFNQIKPIISNEGKQATNEMQALGSSITYMRRYLYMMAMDIVEADSIDGSLGQEPKKTQPPKAPKKAAPATPADREAVKQMLTNTDTAASPLQLKGLAKKMMELAEKKPEAVQAINANLEQNGKTIKTLTKAEADALMTVIKKALEGEGNEGN